MMIMFSQCMIEQLLALTNEFHSSTSTMIEKFNMQTSEKKKMNRLLLIAMNGSHSGQCQLNLFKIVSDEWTLTLMWAIRWRYRWMLCSSSVFCSHPEGSPDRLFLLKILTKETLIYENYNVIIWSEDFNSRKENYKSTVWYLF